MSIQTEVTLQPDNVLSACEGKNSQCIAEIVISSYNLPSVPRWSSLRRLSILVVLIFVRNVAPLDATDPYNTSVREQTSTVVPATAGPLGERPSALAGHFCNVPTTLPC